MFDDKLINSWMEYQKAPLDSEQANKLIWATTEIIELCCSEPEKCWDFILLILSKTQDEQVLAGLAAGPIEDLLVFYPYETIKKIEEEVKKNKKLGGILKHVWQNDMPIEIWDRVKKLQTVF